MQGWRLLQKLWGSQSPGQTGVLKQTELVLGVGLGGLGFVGFRFSFDLVSSLSMPRSAVKFTPRKLLACQTSNPKP